MTKQRQQADQDEVEIDALRRRWWLTIVAMIVLLLLVPLSCAVPMALGKTLPKVLEPWLTGIACGMPLFCLIGAFVLMLTLPRRSRAQAVAYQARRLGLLFEARPNRAQFQGLQSLRCLADAVKRPAAANLVTGEMDGTPLWIVDYSTDAGFDRGKANEQTVFCLPHAVPSAPDFIVTPRTWADTIAQWSGKQGVTLPGREDFLRRFFVGGEDPRAVQHWLPRSVLQAIEAMGNLTLEIKDGDLIALRYDKVVPAKTFRSMVANLRHLAALLSAGQAREIVQTPITNKSKTLPNDQVWAPAESHDLKHRVFQGHGPTEAPRPRQTEPEGSFDVGQAKPHRTAQQGAWGRFSDDNSSWLQGVGVFILLLTSGLPGLEMAGFGLSHLDWRMPTALLVSALGGVVGGAFMGRSNRIAGALGGLVGGPGGLLAVHYYVLARSQIMWGEFVTAQLVGSYPGVGLYFLVIWLWSKVMPPKAKD